MITRSASIVIDRPVADVFAAITDVTRMGEFSPECTAGRWVGPATGPAVGASFEGDNVAALGPLTLKRWTTTSEVTEHAPGTVFAFVTEGFTTWRYEFETVDASTTRVTEAFEHAPFEGVQKLLYQTLMNRPDRMTAGMQDTLKRMKAVLEA